MGLISSGSLQRYEESGEKRTKEKICRIVEKENHWRRTKIEKGIGEKKGYIASRGTENNT